MAYLTRGAGRPGGAEARAAATETTVRQLTDAAAGDRLRFLMRLDHELKNPLTAIRAGLVNIEQTGGTISDGAALATVSVQADRITRLISDLRKLAELETRAIEAAPVDLTGLLHEVAEAAAEIPGVRQRGFRMSVPQAPWPLPLIEGDRSGVRTATAPQAVALPPTPPSAHGGAPAPCQAALSPLPRTEPSRRSG